jgi:hypothetical protein
VALVGATEREGALGRIVYRNLAAGGLRLTRLPTVPDVAVIVTPARTVPGIVEDAGQAGINAAIVLSSGFAEVGRCGVALQQKLLAARAPRPCPGRSRWSPSRAPSAAPFSTGLRRGARLPGGRRADRSGAALRGRHPRCAALHLPELPPRMLARFTQLDYDRELALVAIS